MKLSHQDKVDNIQALGGLLLTLPVISAGITVIKLKLIFWHYDIPVLVFIDLPELAIDLLNNMILLIAAFIFMWLYLQNDLKKRRYRRTKPERSLIIVFIILIFSVSLIWLFEIYIMGGYINSLTVTWMLFSILIFEIYGHKVFYFIRNMSPIKYKNLYSFFGISIWFIILFQFAFIPSTFWQTKENYNFGATIITSNDTINIDSTKSILKLAKSYTILVDLKTKKMKILPKEEIKSFEFPREEKKRL